MAYPRDTNQTLTWCEAQLGETAINWGYLCAGFVARAHGLGHSGEDALPQWNSCRWFCGRRGPSAAWNPGDSLFGASGKPGDLGHVCVAADQNGYAYTSGFGASIELRRVTEIWTSFGLRFLGSVPGNKCEPNGSGTNPLYPADVALWPKVSMAALVSAQVTHLPNHSVELLQRSLERYGFVIPKDAHGHDIGWGYFGPLTRAAWNNAVHATSRSGMSLLRSLGVRGRYVATP